MTHESIVFDRAADFYDETRGFPPGIELRAAALIAEVGALTPGSQVLEIGVGTGRIALPLSRMLEQLYGIDLSRPMIERLRIKPGSDKVVVFEGDITRLPFRSGSFDTLLAVHIFHLVSSYQQALAEAARVLKPEGCLIHAWNERDQADGLDQMWRSATGSGRGANVGMSWEARQTMLKDNGWQPRAEPLTLQYEIRRAPQEYVDGLRRRVWSHTWRMSDEALEAGIREVEAYIAEHYDDPHAVEVMPSAFVAQAYAPPR